MDIMNGMEPMVFSYAYYKVNNAGAVISFFKTLAKKGFFSIDESKPENFKGAFLLPYPKDHWNPLSKLLGAKQVVGGAELKEGILLIDTRSKTGLRKQRELVEKCLCSDITFEREEFEDVMEALKKKK